MEISFKYLYLGKKHCVSCLSFDEEKKFFSMLNLFNQFEDFDSLLKYGNNGNFKVDFPNPSRLKILEDIHMFDMYFHFRGLGVNRFFGGVKNNTLYIMYIDPQGKIDKKVHK